MKSKAHSKKCVELGIVPVPITAEDQQLDDSKSSGEIAIAGDSDTDDGDDVDDMDDDEDDEKETQAMIVAMVVDRNGKDFGKVINEIAHFRQKMRLKKGKVN